MLRRPAPLGLSQSPDVIGFRRKRMERRSPGPDLSTATVRWITPIKACSRGRTTWIRDKRPRSDPGPRGRSDYRFHAHRCPTPPPPSPQHGDDPRLLRSYKSSLWQGVDAVRVRRRSPRPTPTRSDLQGIVAAGPPLAAYTRPSAAVGVAH
jgi:hypothetical protein